MLKVIYSVIIRLNKYGLLGIVARGKPLLAKQNMALRLRFPKLHLEKTTSLLRERNQAYAHTTLSTPAVRR